MRANEVPTLGARLAGAVATALSVVVWLVSRDEDDGARAPRKTRAPRQPRRNTYAS